MRQASIFSIALLSLTASAPTARSAIIFSTFHPELGIPNEGVGIAEFHGDIGQVTLGFAEQIEISGGTYELDSLTVALLPILPGNSATFAVLADANDSPGSVLESFPINGISDGPRLYSANSTTHPLLLDGGVYWVAGFVSSASEDIGWAVYLNPPQATVASGPLSDGTWQVFASSERIFTLEGTLVAPSVPEPRMDLVAALLLVWLAVLARRRNYSTS
jgi:hypothetical protein